MVISQKKAVENIQITRNGLYINIFIIDLLNVVFQFFVGGGCCFVSGERAEQQFHFVFIAFDIVDPVNVIIKNSLQILGGQMGSLL